MRKVAYLFFFVLTIVCCNSTSSYQLENIDSMIECAECDSALSALSAIDTTQLSTTERAYYLLLRNIAKYKIFDANSSVEELEYCINTFAKCGDKDKLAKSHICKGAILLDRNQIDKAIVELKMAEDIVTGLGVPELIIRTKAHLTFANIRSANNMKALSYAREALRIARDNESRRWIGYSLQSIGIVYDRIGYVDSASYYFNQSVPYIQDQPAVDQSGYIYNIAIGYKSLGLIQKAKDCLSSIAQNNKDPKFKASMAQLYSASGDDDKAEYLWKEALGIDDIRLRIYYMNEYVAWLQSKGRTADALQYTQEMVDLKDSLQRILQTEAIRELQEKHDREVREKESRHTQFMLVMICVVILLILFSILLYNRYKMQKAKKQIAQNNVLIQNFSAQLDELIRQDKQHSKEVRQLTLKIDSLREKQDELLKKGKARYSEITDGGNTVVWRKADFTDFVEYYRILHPEFLYEIELKYSSLPVTNLFYLILHDMGYSDSDAQRILSLSDGALRTMKSRIRKKEKESGQPANDRLVTP